ncbi:hypothetical protein CEXT_756511 [Caerostris extrusa]|uniref:Uncharacterized protein n=1 Tax=Caerostris extrusa TaxID=172846 RepID=A0AAV4UGF2_CAEEX|nr:hypothetical protein CEXT_756511 [Caerostris extrusa]
MKLFVERQTQPEDGSTPDPRFPIADRVGLCAGRWCLTTIWEKEEQGNKKELAYYFLSKFRTSSLEYQHGMGWLSWKRHHVDRIPKKLGLLLFHSLRGVNGSLFRWVLFLN